MSFVIKWLTEGLIVTAEFLHVSADILIK